MELVGETVCEGPGVVLEEAGPVVFALLLLAVLLAAATPAAAEAADAAAAAYEGVSVVGESKGEKMREPVALGGALVLFADDDAVEANRSGLSRAPGGSIGWSRFEG